ncbi:hypothetical protein [Klebsiella pneumoniae]|uniref:hypothetical protein n=1 Tax=Klebsiella pneumoniae TaxID=573 RepID=UPI001F4A240D
MKVLKPGFPAAPAKLHGHAINGVPVHRFRRRSTPETGLPLAEWFEFPRYALARILMHAGKTEPARFWRVFGWFFACFPDFPLGASPMPVTGSLNFYFSLFKIYQVVLTIILF